MPRLRIGRILAALTVATMAAVPVGAHAVFPCPTPMIFAAPFAPGDTNEVTWFGGDAGGFTIQVAATPDFGALVDTATVGPTADSREFSNLKERAHFYRVRANAKSGVCTTSAWSTPVKTTQDATPPQVTISTQPEPIEPTPITPPMPIYVMEDIIEIEGSSIDVPGGMATEASGAFKVAIALVNTTPVIGANADVPVYLLNVDTDGTWLLRLCDDDRCTVNGEPSPKPATGTYSILAQGIDKVGNVNEDPTELGFIVIL